MGGKPELHRGKRGRGMLLQHRLVKTDWLWWGDKRGWQAPVCAALGPDMMLKLSAVTVWWNFHDLQTTKACSESDCADQCCWVEWEDWSNEILGLLRLGCVRHLACVSGDVLQRPLGDVLVEHRAFLSLWHGGFGVSEAVVAIPGPHVSATNVPRLLTAVMVQMSNFNKLYNHLHPLVVLSLPKPVDISMLINLDVTIYCIRHGGFELHQVLRVGAKLPPALSILWAEWWNNYLIKATAKNPIARTQFQRKTELPSVFLAEDFAHRSSCRGDFSSRLFRHLGWSGQGQPSEILPTVLHNGAIWTEAGTHNPEFQEVGKGATRLLRWPRRHPEDGSVRFLLTAGCSRTEMWCERASRHEINVEWLLDGDRNYFTWASGHFLQQA